MSPVAYEQRLGPDNFKYVDGDIAACVKGIIIKMELQQSRRESTSDVAIMEAMLMPSAMPKVTEITGGGDRCWIVKKFDC